MEQVASIIGNIILWIILGFGVIGALGACKNDKTGIGAEWHKGIAQIGLIFWSCAGFYTLLPYFTQISAFIFTKFAVFLGSDPAVLGSSLIVIDGGGYQLAKSLAASQESWILAFFASSTLGCVLSFALPIGLTMVKDKDRKYFSLGILGGVLSTPFSVIIGGVLLMVFQPNLRSIVSVNAANDMTLNLTLPIIIQNTLPLILFCLLLALMLFFFPESMCRGFIVFGKVLNTILRIAFMLAVIELYTGVFTKFFGDAWLFSPIIADEESMVRALEVVGMIGMMLSGAYPMIYIIRKYFSNILNAFGSALKFSSVGACALIGLLVNEMVMFELFSDMTPKDKVRTLAFANGAAFVLADQLSFTLNFQPNLYFILFITKILTGLVGLFIVDRFFIKAIERFEKLDQTDFHLVQNNNLDLECERTVSNS